MAQRRPASPAPACPFGNLFDYVAGGDTLDEFLAGFPGVTRDQAIHVLERAAGGLLDPISGR